MFSYYILVDSNKNPSTSDQWTINLNGKSYVSILHEYIQRVLKTQPSYEFKELGWYKSMKYKNFS